MRARRPEARFAMLSTAWSRTDPFWMTWESDDPSWIRLKATADTVRYDPEFLEKERRALGEDGFKREYLGIPAGWTGKSLGTCMTAQRKFTCPWCRLARHLVRQFKSKGCPFRIPSNVSDQSEDCHDI